MSGASIGTSKGVFGRGDCMLCGCPASRAQESVAWGSPSRRTAGCCSPAGRCARSPFGWLSVILALYLAGRGFRGGADRRRVSPRRWSRTPCSRSCSRLSQHGSVAARVMAMTAPLLAVGGLLLAIPRKPGMAPRRCRARDPESQRPGSRALSPMEQALLPRPRGFGLGNTPVRLVQRVRVPARGGGRRASRRGPRVGSPPRTRALEGRAGHAPRLRGAGFVLAALYARLARLEPARRKEPVPVPARRFGLARSRKVVLPLAGLQAVDALPAASSCRASSPTGSTCGSGSAPKPSVPSSSARACSRRRPSSSRRAWRSVWDSSTRWSSPTCRRTRSSLARAVRAELRDGRGAVLLRQLLSQMDVPTRQAFLMAIVPRSRARARRRSPRRWRARLTQAASPAVTGG